MVYSETGRNGNGEGYGQPPQLGKRHPTAIADSLLRSFVEFETAADLVTAVEKLDGREFKEDKVVNCVANVSDLPLELTRWDDTLTP